MEEQTYTVHVKWDADKKVWTTDGEDIPGLVCESDTLEELIEAALDAAPDLLHENARILSGKPINIIVVAERKVVCIAA
jgi:hypothetical protein